jgi:broad specificity phosphatase PhoE
MARLYLITHAHTQIDPAVDAAHWQLSPTGQAQADALAALPFWAKVDRILVSSEVKTYLTIAPVLARRTIPVTADSRFDEVQRAGWVEDYARPRAGILRFARSGCRRMGDGRARAAALLWPVFTTHPGTRC